MTPGTLLLALLNHGLELRRYARSGGYRWIVQEASGDSLYEVGLPVSDLFASAHEA
jgi:hypothetical protein